MKERVSYKLRCYPTPCQMKVLSLWMGGCRFIYNAGLEQRVLAYKMTGTSLSYISQQNELPACKKVEGFEWLKDIPSQSLQMALRNLDRAFTNFYAGRANFPQRKRKGRCVESITFPQGERISIAPSGNSQNFSFLSGFPKLGKGLKIFQHRKIEGKIKTATITKSAGQWFVSLSCERLNKAPNLVKNPETVLDHEAVGVDLGIAKSICTDKEEFHLETKRLKKLEKQISVLQRKMSREKKFSDSWKKIKKYIAKKYSKIARIRQDFLHKVSSMLCKNHAVVCLENLKIKNMSKSSKGTLENPGKNVAAKSGLNRSILRQGWGMFREMCEYKSLRYGGEVVLVPPQNTSRACSACGHTEASNRKSQSDFLCLQCGYAENADRNAAKNIKALGLQSLGLQAKACNRLDAPTIIASAI